MVYGTIVIVKRSGNDGSKFLLTSQKCTFGTGLDCDIRINLPNVGATQCSLSVSDDDSVQITNLNDNQPTRVNKIPIIKAQKLYHKDIFSIIDRHFRFEYPSDSCHLRSKPELSQHDEVKICSPVEKRPNLSKDQNGYRTGSPNHNPEKGTSIPSNDAAVDMVDSALENTPDATKDEIPKPCKHTENNNTLTNNLKISGTVVIVKRSGKDGSKFLFTEQKCSFGTHLDCDIRINLPTVGEKHCCLTLSDDNSVCISNYNDENPTLVNSLTFNKTRKLCHMDVFTVAERKFRFEYPIGSIHLQSNSSPDKSESSGKSVDSALPAKKIKNGDLNGDDTPGAALSHTLGESASPEYKNLGSPLPAADDTSKSEDPESTENNDALSACENGPSSMKSSPEKDNTEQSMSDNLKRSHVDNGLENDETPKKNANEITDLEDGAPPAKKKKPDLEPLDFGDSDDDMPPVSWSQTLKQSSSPEYESQLSPILENNDATKFLPSASPEDIAKSPVPKALIPQVEIVPNRVNVIPDGSGDANRGNINPDLIDFDLELLSDPVYRDTLAISKIFPNRDQTEIYALLQHFHGHSNPVQRVVEDYLKINKENASLEQEDVPEVISNSKAPMKGELRKGKSSASRMTVEPVDIKNDVKKVEPVQISRDDVEVIERYQINDVEVMHSNKQFKLSSQASVETLQYSMDAETIDLTADSPQPFQPAVEENDFKDDIDRFSKKTVNEFLPIEDVPIATSSVTINIAGDSNNMPISDVGANSGIVTANLDGRVTPPPTLPPQIVRPDSVKKDTAQLKEIFAQFPEDSIYKKLLNRRSLANRMEIVTNELIEENSSQPMDDNAQASETIFLEIEEVCKMCLDKYNVVVNKPDVVFAMLEESTESDHDKRVDSVVQEFVRLNPTPAGNDTESPPVEDPTDMFTADLNNIHAMFPNMDKKVIRQSLIRNNNVEDRINAVIEDLLRDPLEQPIKVETPMEVDQPSAAEAAPRPSSSTDNPPSTSASLPAAAAGRSSPEDAVPGPSDQPDEETIFQNKVFELSNIFPDCDPDYLEKSLKEHMPNPEHMMLIVALMLEKKDYPKLKDSLEKKQKEALRRRLLQFNMEDFLAAFPNPSEYFMDTSRSMSANYKAHALAQLKQDFIHFTAGVIEKTLEEKKGHYTPAKVELDKTNDKINAFTIQQIVPGKRKGKKKIQLPPDVDPTTLSKTKRPMSECTLPENMDEQFYNELMFVKHEIPIRELLAFKQRQKEKRLQSAKANGQLLECGCCFDDELLAEDMKDCEVGHLFCTECVRRQAEVLIGDSKTAFPCLSEGCEKQFSLNILKQVLQPKIFSRLLQKIQEEEIKAANIDDLESCPFCSYATVMPDPNDKVFKCLNQECFRESCRLCREPNHIPLRCEEVEKQNDTKARTYVENKMTEALIRVCNSCKKPFMKESGCNKMTCTCGAMMCYVCKQPITGYEHFDQHNGGRGKKNSKKCPLTSDMNALHFAEVDNALKVAVNEVKDKDPVATIDKDKLLAGVPKADNQQPGLFGNNLGVVFGGVPYRYNPDPGAVFNVRPPVFMDQLPQRIVEGGRVIQRYNAPDHRNNPRLHVPNVRPPNVPLRPPQIPQNNQRPVRRAQNQRYPPGNNPPHQNNRRT